MTDKEARKLPIGTMIVALSSGEITVTSGFTIRCVELPGKPWGIVVGNDCLKLKPSGWRRATIEEVERVYELSKANVDKEENN